ncbi:MAG: hypothetical protein DWQ36_06275 [Acidobacteria bacterium]|nr:MAG: hypothetical protein DWQ30_19280 [Acidobacteriota bacterium]REK09651.1 MAG: hypothetical protein DWQ36_06275 [Acidobacteriota bacterium]
MSLRAPNFASPVVLLVLLLSQGPAFDAAHAVNHTVLVGPGNTFTPSSLTITVGDSVTWTNQGGLHNVRATSGANFRCANGCDGQGGNGSVSTNAWSFTLTFDAPANIDYECEAHAAFGMVGSLTVEGGQVEPGTLRLAQSSYTVGEAGGAANITVQRTGGVDGAVSVAYATSNGSASAGSDYTAASGTLTWADGDGATKSFQVPILDDGEDEPNETVNLTLSSPSGGATLGTSSATLTINDNDDPPADDPGTLGFAQTTIEVGEDAGEATVTVARTSGTDGAISVGYSTADGSATAGSDYAATSGVLEWPDGDGSARTFAVTVFDDGETEPDETVNLMLADVTGGASLGASTATLTVVDDDQPPPPPCEADETTLCLGEGGRFRVEVGWRDFEGNEGDAMTQTLAAEDSGLFYFFAEDNIEMLVKVLDACGLAGVETYWVLFAAATNVEFTVVVTDTLSGEEQEYTNPLGTLASAVIDVAAFDTCP